MTAAFGPGQPETEFGKAEVFFTQKVSHDSSGRWLEWEAKFDSVFYLSHERDSSENAFMSRRLRDYSLKMVMASTGEVIRISESLELPNIELSGYDFGRQLLLLLPAFSGQAIKPGDSWSVEQNLWDKVDPDIRIVKTQKLKKVGGGDSNRSFQVDYTFASLAGKDKGFGFDSDSSVLQGIGKYRFHADEGRLIEAELKIQKWVSLEQAGQVQGDEEVDASPIPVKTLILRQYLRLFSP